jgi:hypothetical protein
MNVDGIDIQFPENWIVERYDNWAYVRNQFNGAAGGCKAVDVIAKDHQDVLWFIEVKDYRYNRRTKVIDLADEIAIKVRDSMAGLVAAAGRAEAPEKKQAVSLLGFKRIRVALHLEQPNHHSKLFPRPADPVSLQQKLRSRIKPIDPHPVITSKRAPYPGVQWSVM